MSLTFVSRLALLMLCCSMMAPASAQDDFVLGDDDCEDDDDVDDDDRRVEAELLGLCEVPSISTTGRGLFRGEIDDTVGSITWTLQYRDLEGSVEQAHIHFGQERTNGGITVFLCSNLGNAPGVQPCPNAPGSISGTITAEQVVGPVEQGINTGEFAEFLAAVRAGAAYANVHTTLHPNGEIRGQIVEDDDDDDD